VTAPPSPDRHRRTLEVYEGRALEWQDRRPPRLDGAERFTADLSTDVDLSAGGTDTAEGTLATDGSAADRSLPPGATVDLGCGPGWHLPALPPGTVAVDGAAAMLDLVAGHSPDSPRVRADLRALPFARHSLRAVWANKSYVHLQRSLVPLALWDLHRAMAVGAVAHLGLFGGDREHEGFDDDPFAGRSFSLWPTDLLCDVVVGAGFELLALHEPGRDTHRGEAPHLAARLRRRRTLADTVGPGMRLLLVGLNPSMHAADSGVGFSGPGNRGWPALLASGLATVDRDPVHLLGHHGIGMTDLVKRATAKAAELRPEEYRDGLARLERLCAWLQPAAVCVIGLTGWRHAVDRRAVAGEQPGTLGGRPVWLMPNPSGLNAHVTVGDLAGHLRAAASLADTALAGTAPSDTSAADTSAADTSPVGTA